MRGGDLLILHQNFLLWRLIVSTAKEENGSMEVEMETDSLGDSPYDAWKIAGKKKHQFMTDSRCQSTAPAGLAHDIRRIRSKLNDWLAALH